MKCPVKTQAGDCFLFPWVFWEVLIVEWSSMGCNSPWISPRFWPQALCSPTYFGFAVKLTLGAPSTSISFTPLPKTAFACQILIALLEDNYGSFITLAALWAFSFQIQLLVQLLTRGSETLKNFPASSSTWLIHKYLQLFPGLGIWF